MAHQHPSIEERPVVVQVSLKEMYPNLFPRENLSTQFKKRIPLHHQSQRHHLGLCYNGSQSRAEGGVADAG